MKMIQKPPLVRSSTPMNINTVTRTTFFRSLMGILLLLKCSVVVGQPGIGQRFLPKEVVYNTSGASAIVTTDITHQSSTTTKAVDDDHSGLPSREFFGVFTKLGSSWHTILHMFRTIINTAGGIDYRDDVYAETMEEALAGLKSMASSSDWDFQDIGVPLKEFSQSSDDDVYRAFLRWAIADGANDNSNNINNQLCKLEGGVNGRQKRINISKSYRRLVRYVTWMQDVREDIIEPPLTSSSLRSVWKTFSMKVTYDDCERLVWWLDLGAANLDEIRFELSPKEIIRLFVWISHYMMFNENAQANGIVICNSLANVGFWPFMTMLPLELGMSIDEFVMSIIPLKTKFVLLLQRPPWAKFAYQMLKPFIISNMRRRVVVVEDGLYSHNFVYEVLGNGSQCIPAGVDDYYAGSSDADIVGKLFEEEST